MTFRRNFCSICVAIALSVSTAAAQGVKAANAWARATAPGQKNASVYLELTSESNAAVVVVGSPAAAHAELHSMTMSDGVMRMRPLARIELPAGQTVKLSPNGLHVMLVDLKQPLKEGAKLPLVLSVQSSGTSLTTLNIEAEVRGIDGSPPHQH
ncbi:MAG: copper chaperone PCu(A)C [Burkholderiales bacterium]